MRWVTLLKNSLIQSSYYKPSIQWIAITQTDECDLTL
jgi:hypothetical protein